MGRSSEARPCVRPRDDQNDDQQRMEYGPGLGDRIRGPGPGAVADGRRSQALFRSFQEQTEAGVLRAMSEQKNEGAGEWEGWSVAGSPQQSANPATQIINPPELAKPRGFSHGLVVEGGRLLMLAGQD